ncbi:MAG: TlyA family RNA methyltransferase, partial [Magnetococcales bacterium]|nr:TlyA family RNA methyltransferase [Magnetococcales bacterium]
MAKQKKHLNYNPSKQKHRLDQRLVDAQLVVDLDQARRLIMAGQVLVDDRPINQPGVAIPTTASLRLREQESPWVSRGGLKLAHALEQWPIHVAGSVCLDIGSSTGGFCDVLLSQGATRVFAVDVGYGQLAWKLRQDPRVINLERTNVRHLNQNQIPETVDLLTMDVSFLSLRKALAAVIPFLNSSGRIIALLKPQFELPRTSIPEGGVVTDAALHDEAADLIRSSLPALNLEEIGFTPSPILGPKGNREF